MLIIIHLYICDNVILEVLFVGQNYQIFLEIETYNCLMNRETFQSDGNALFGDMIHITERASYDIFFQDYESFTIRSVRLNSYSRFVRHGQTKAISVTWILS